MPQITPFARMLSLDPMSIMPAANDAPQAQAALTRLSHEQGRQFAMQSGFICMENHRVIFEMPRHTCEPLIN